VQRQSRFARAFRPVDFDDASARQAANAKRNVEAERAGRYTVAISTTCSLAPSRMIEPLPKARSICDSAASNSFCLIHCLRVLNKPQRVLSHDTSPLSRQ
jgi:hypothetical protein